MKYDAKAALISNPTVGLQPKLGDPCDGKATAILMELIKITAGLRGYRPK